MKLKEDLQHLTNNVKVLSEKVSQKTKRKNKREWAKVMDRVAQVQADIDNGVIVLPDPGANAVWSIID